MIIFFLPYTRIMLNSFRNGDTVVIQRSVLHVMRGQGSLGIRCGLSIVGHSFWAAQTRNN